MYTVVHVHRADQAPAVKRHECTQASLPLLAMAVFASLSSPSHFVSVVVVCYYSLKREQSRCTSHPLVVTRFFSLP